MSELTLDKPVTLISWSKIHNMVDYYEKQLTVETIPEV